MCTFPDCLSWAAALSRPDSRYTYAILFPCSCIKDKLSAHAQCFVKQYTSVYTIVLVCFNSLFWSPASGLDPSLRLVFLGISNGPHLVSPSRLKKSLDLKINSLAILLVTNWVPPCRSHTACLRPRSWNIVSKCARRRILTIGGPVSEGRPTGCMVCPASCRTGPAGWKGWPRRLWGWPSWLLGWPSQL